MTVQGSEHDLSTVTVPQMSQTFEISDADSYARAMRTLSEAKRPAWILQALMNAFETYRQSRKIGWSRPWNKVGVTTFKSFKLDFSANAELIDLVRPIISGLSAEKSVSIPQSATDFIDELLSDSQQKRRRLMGFLFYQEIEVEGRLCEAVTLSLGRVSGKRHRDRLDLILEAPLDQTSAAPVSRIRLYIDPYLGVAPPVVSLEVTGSGARPFQGALEKLGALYCNWDSTKGNLWDHWTSRYIDYFGPRQHHSMATHFLEPMLHKIPEHQPEIS